MSITFVQAIAQWTGSPPATSGSFTPNSGDSILVAAFVDALGYTIAYSGTGGSYAAGFQGNGISSVSGAGYCLSISAGAHTATINSTAGFMQAIVGLDYSGVSGISATGTDINTPGTGVGACEGTSVLVPSGSVLAAVCFDITAGGETITSPSGTTRASQSATLSYLAVDYAGAGSAIRPSFTCPLGASSEYFVLQWLLSATTGKTPFTNYSFQPIVAQ